MRQETMGSGQDWLGRVGLGSARFSLVGDDDSRMRELVRCGAGRVSSRFRAVAIVINQGAAVLGGAPRVLKSCTSSIRSVKSATANQAGGRLHLGFRSPLSA